MTEEPQDEKKIFVDEDWKSRIEAEKDAARKEQQAETAGQAPSASAPKGPLPPPDLTFLAGSLYLQGLVSLGLLPHPASDKPEVHLEQAKHTIDTLQMLHEKTEGNRTAEETNEIDTMIHELRLSYVGVQQQPASENEG